MQNPAPSAPESAALGFLNPQNEALVVILAIILIAGGLGGWAAFLAQQDSRLNDDDSSTGSRWLKFIIMGAVAAACVPLFLSLLKSDLLVSAFRQPVSSTIYDNYLVFAGLCLVSAFSARRFIDTISERIFREVKEVRRDVAIVDARAIEANALAHEALQELEAADEPANDGLGVTTSDIAEAQDTADPEMSDKEAGRKVVTKITAEEDKVLRALSHMTYRTATGAAESSGIGRHKIADILESLADKRLVVPTKSARTGGARWAISSRGLDAIGRLRDNSE